MSKVTIVDYKEYWPREFKEIGTEMRSVVSNGVLCIDHIGSTAVPGLAAKDKIDIQITVINLEDTADIDSLQSLGYALLPDINNDLLTGLDSKSPDLQKKVIKQKQGQRSTNIHIREDKRLNQISPLVFRDYLRFDALTREAYAEIKRELANSFAYNIEAYYAIKDPYMDTVYQAAKMWAKATNWQPDNSFI